MRIASASVGEGKEGEHVGEQAGAVKSGEPCRTRTYNLEIKSLLLYQLS